MFASLLLGLAAAAGGEATDFGLRAPPGERLWISDNTPPRQPRAAETRMDLTDAVALGAHWGVVTSTMRSPRHNLAVGGAPHSYHLQGRAIDIARFRGVSHTRIAAAYRAAGYQLLESLDEGDHSHFAFAGLASRMR